MKKIKVNFKNLKHYKHVIVAGILLVIVLATLIYINI